MNMAIAKSLFIWLAFLPLGILNGGLRMYVLDPKLGAAGRPISGVLLALMLFALAYLFVPRLGALSRADYIKMGILWALLTVAAETVIGLIEGESLAAIARNYSFAGGNLWTAIVVLIGFLPSIVARIKGLV
jgi:hypothetical protein